MDEIKDVASLIGLVKQFAGTTHANARNWYRGQGNAQWDLRPGVYRGGFANSDPARLLKEQHMNQEFKILSAGLRRGGESDAELYFLQQHYGMPTRLLDWSQSPLFALFSAVAEPKHSDTDGKLFYIDAYELNGNRDLTHGTLKFKGIATGSNPCFKSAVEVISLWRTLADFPNFIMPVRPEYRDLRIGLQRSCFTFHVHARQIIVKSDFPVLREFLVPKASKITIRSELAALGIDKFSSYGNMDHIADRIMTTYADP